jgi:hypothetical protein
VDFAQSYYAFNSGLVSPNALARLDLKRMALAADIHTNWMPQVLGPMLFRPGLAFLNSTLNNSTALNMDFVFGQDDSALLELTAGFLRVRISDTVVTRPVITSCSTTGTARPMSRDRCQQPVRRGARSRPNGTQRRGRRRLLAGERRRPAIAGHRYGGGDPRPIDRCQRRQCRQGARGHHRRGARHGDLRIGTTEGGDELLGDRTLRAGTHSIAVTPSATMYLRFSSSASYACIVSSVTIEQAGGDMAIATPWGAADLDYLRWEQSGDVIFVACRGVQQRRIERQDRTSTPASRSWSVVEYVPTDGPFGALNVGPVQLQGSALSGEITLTASKNFFKSTHVGALFRLASAGQTVSQRITSQNTFTNAIKVTGVGTAGRSFQVSLTGPTFTATTTVTLQRSIATPGTWSDVATYTGITTVSIYDNLDNQIAYYRIGVKTGAFTGGDDLTAQLIFSAGSINGVVRVTGYTDAQHVSASVLSPLGAAAAYTSDWYEGDWSPKNGYPSAVALADGRLSWFGKGYNWLSASNLFDSFDDTAVGDGATIRRTMGAGPVDQPSWALALNFLLVGTAGPVLVCKASSIDEPLTPTKFSQKPVTDVGAAQVRAVKIDTNGVYVSRNGSRIYQLSADANLYSINPYAPIELTELYPTIGAPGIKRIAVQRHPNTRIHLVRSDGVAVVIVFDKAEQVTCMLLVTTDGLIEDAAVLPGTTAAPTEDQVYYTVARTIGGVTKRYLEKWSLESQAIGASDTRLMDGHVALTGVQGPVITGLSHLEGKSVVAWIDGTCSAFDADNDPVQYVVTGGQITLPRASTSFVCVGLPYTAQWRCCKMAVGSRMQAPLTQYKNVDRIGFVLANTHPLGLSYGQTFDLDSTGASQLDDLPLVEDGTTVNVDTVWPSYDKVSMPMDGTWDTDPRICLQAQSPLPCTVLGIVVTGEGHDAR